MSEPLIPLDPGLRAALRAAWPAPAGARERVRARLHAAVPEMGRPQVESARDASESGPTKAFGRGVASLATFLAGGVTGAALLSALTSHSVWRIPSEARSLRSEEPAAFVDASDRRSNLDDPIACVSGASHALAGARAIPERERRARAELAASGVQRTPASSGGSRFAVERSLLDDARAGILQNEPARALERLERHRALFPNGLLVEERDAMRVEALVLAKRYDEARSLAYAFRSRSPGSLFLSTVDSALGSVP